jgi:hypothetical protein
VSVVRKALTVLGAIFAILILLVLIKCAVAVIGGPDDEERIETAIEQYYLGGAAWSCEHRATSAYLERRFEAREPYARASCELDTAEPAEYSVEPTVTHVDGDRAQARVRFDGGAFNGSTVSVRLVHEDGYWRIDGLDSFEHFDRAALRRAYRAQLIAAGTSRRATACILSAEAKHSDAELERALLFHPSRTFTPITVRCDREGTIRELLAAGVQGATDLTAAGLDCLESRLRRAPDGELVRLSSDLPASIALRERCDPGYLAEYVRRTLSSSQSPATVRSVASHIDRAALPAATATVYDRDRMEALIDNCESKGG